MNRAREQEVSELNQSGQRVGRIVPAWTERRRPERIDLAGKHSDLEPIESRHAEELYSTLCGPDDQPLWTYRPTDPPSSVADMAAFIDSLARDDTTVTWAIRPHGRPASGMTTFMRIETSTGQVEVAAVIYARQMQRTPASTEATHLLMTYAFDDLGYRRFEWKCDSFNQASQRAALRLGFRYEGRFRNHMITRNQSRDTDWFSVDCDEWTHVRRAYSSAGS